MHLSKYLDAWFSISQLFTTSRSANERNSQINSVILECAHSPWLYTSLKRILLQMGRVDAYPPQSNKKETALAWTDVFEKPKNATHTSGKPKNATLLR